jgi:hypothetical protein
MQPGRVKRKRQLLIGAPNKLIERAPSSFAQLNDGSAVASTTLKILTI